jgi:TonB family protein
MNLQAIRAIETRIRSQSSFSTAIAGLLLLVFVFFWTISKVGDPPLTEIDEEKYEIVAEVQLSRGGGPRADFGNNVEGSKQVNNFDAPTPNPTPRPSGNPPDATPDAAPAAPPSEPIMSQITDAEIKAPPPVESAAPAAPSTAPAAPTPAKKPKKKKEARTAESLFTTTTGAGGGGSNHGDGKGVGNRGNPKAITLDPKGLFAWGDGSGGSGGGGDGGLGSRKLIAKVNPTYTAQEEGKFVIRLLINPQGEVISVKIIKGFNGQNQIKSAVEKALNKWRFSEIEGSKTQQVTLTYHFKLR